MTDIWLLPGISVLETPWFKAPCPIITSTPASDWMRQFWIVLFSDRPEAQSGLAILGVRRVALVGILVFWLVTLFALLLCLLFHLPCFFPLYLKENSILQIHLF